jgi:uncharacterized protein (TIGR03435 family)
MTLASSVLVTALRSQAPQAGPVLGGQPKFEVASIRADESNAPRSIRWAADGVTLVNLPLANIMFQSYDLASWQFDFSRFQPIFLRRYDIFAKAPYPVSRHELQLMLQNLVAERFHMRVHHEQRVEPVLALIVEKTGPKLDAPTAPDREGEFDKRLGPNEPMQSITFRNASMELLCLTVMEVADMSKLRPGQPVQVVDKTGLKGGFDYTLKWTLEEPVPGDATLPDRLPSMIPALHRVGLALKTDKAPLDHLVVDAIDRVPTDN